MTLNVGLVGLGFGEKVLLPALRRVAGVKVVAVASAHADKARAAAIRCRIPRSAKNWRALVADPGIDAVAMALPPAVQYVVARRALQLKKHVFCEKPLAVTARQARELSRLAARNRVAAAVDLELPLIDAWYEAKTVLDGGTLGDVAEVQVVWNVQTYAVKHDLVSWKTDPACGGAALNNFVSHTFNYIEHFLGDPIRRVNCRLFRARGLKRVKGETGVHLFMETRRGIAVTAVVTTHAPGEAEHRLVFLGSRGRLTLENRGLDYGAGFALKTGLDGAKRDVLLNPKSFAKKWTEDGRIEPVSRVMKRWVDAARKKRGCVPGFAEGARVQSLIEAARRSNRIQKWVACG